MTIVNEVIRRRDHVAAGSATFVYDFPILSSDDLRVLLNGVLTTDYVVNGVGADAGGTIVFNTVPANGVKVTILGDQPYKQVSTYTLEAFPPSRIQNDFNHLAISDQQIVEIVRRALRAPEVDNLDMTLPSVASRATRILGFDSSGLPTSVIPGVSSGGDVSLATVIATGSITARSLGARFSDWANVLDYGADPIGVADSTTAFQAAINTGKGLILVPSGIYLISTGPLVLTRAVTIASFGTFPGSTPANSGIEGKAVIKHNYDGDLFTIVGVAGDVNVSSGYGFENLVLLNIAGNGGGQKGTAIHAVYGGATQVPTWIRIRNVQVEIQSGKDEWTYGIFFDGSTVGGNPLRDIWIESSRIAVGANGTAAIRLVNVGNVTTIGTLLNDTKGHLQITGSGGALSSAIDVIGGGGVTLALDFAQNVRVIGGGWSNVTMTANTLTSQIYPDFITNTPSAPTNTNTISAYINALARHTFYGPLTVVGPLALTDGVTAPGAVAGLAQLYVDTADGLVKMKRGGGSIRVLDTLATEFISSDQTVTLSSTLNVVHSLGAKPKLVMVALKNATAELNYSVGDEIPLSGVLVETAASTQGAHVVMDATNVTIVTAATLNVRNKTTQVSAAITAGSWKYVVRAWL